MMNAKIRCPRRRSMTLLAGMLTASVTLLALSARAPAHSDDDKKPLTHHDYHSWRAIQSPIVSNDGAYAAYVLSPADGEGEVVAYNIYTGTQFKHHTGKTAAAGAAADKGKGKGAAAEGGAGTRIAFSSDSKHLIFSIAAPKADTGAKEAKEGTETPRSSLGIMDLSTGKVKVIPNVRNFALPEARGVDLIAFHKFPSSTPEATGEKKIEAPEGKKSDEQAFDQKKGGKGGKGGAAGGGAKGPAQVGELFMQNLLSGAGVAIADVADYSLTRSGQWLICSIVPKEGDPGVYAFSTPNGKLIKLALTTGKGKYSRFTWDENQRFFAFIADRSENKDNGTVSLLIWDRENPFGAGGVSENCAVEITNSKSTAGLKPGMVLAERGPISITEDGARVFFSVGAPVSAQDKEPAKEETKGGKSADEKVNVELWHWKDDFIQPMQKVRANQEKQRTYTAVFHARDRRVIQLGDKTLATIVPNREGTWALGTDDTPYRPLVAYDSNYADYYLVNTSDGTRKPLLAKQHWGINFSPNGNYAIYYDGKDWNTVTIPYGQVVNITKTIPTKFAVEDIDLPSPPPAYGMAGWSTDEYHVILNDRYDLWQVSARGGGFRNLTSSFGRKEKIEYRVVKLDPKEKSIDLTKPILARAESHETRDTGFAVLDPTSDKRPYTTDLVRSQIGVPIKAKHADTLVFTRQTFFDFPDLYYSANMQFNKLGRISDANPQKNKFNWGRSELIHYRSADGAPLQGVLIKPENFDPSKKYPMIVYIYEKLSQNLHHFAVPKEGTSINPTYYASNGYLVLMPDIVYNIGYPGQSAMKCVLPAIQAVADKGILNENAIGIQGHSWGGYQIAYMVTQTGRFKAAAAGAAVSDMISAYDGIRWGTGLPRQFQYEKTQSRIGGTLWEYPMRFVENSPIFGADRVRTPLLLLHNDQDDAVPWYQGIEYYLALRRLGKEVYMFNYPGEKHGLTKKANQMDYTIRMQQFFDHHLRGAAAPEWMLRGIPYTPPTGGKGPAIMADDH